MSGFTATGYRYLLTWGDGGLQEHPMSDERGKSVDAIRKQVHSYLAALTPQEAKAMRARFGFSAASRSDEDEEPVRALARELARLKKKR